MLFYHKGLRGRKAPLPFVACARKTVILRGQIWSAHESDVVGLRPDFSVVLFRSTLMLSSEKNRMKVHKNQWLLTMLYPLVRLAGATSRGQTMAPEGQKPSKWLCLTNLPREMYSQPIVHKALSWGAIRMSACVLTEITIRKSQRYTNP